MLFRSFVVFAAGWHRGPTHPENAPAAPLAEFQPVTAPQSDTAIPADPASASIPPAGETETQNLPPPAPVPDSAPAALVTIPALDRLRQDFEAFLDRAGADTARLSDSQRQAFFDEYLEWLRQTSLGPGQGVMP